MTVTLEPTPEMWLAPINGTRVPLRVWRGTTSGGLAIEAHVLAITPANKDASATEALRAELPPFMVRARDLYAIDLTSETEGALQINKPGLEPPNV